MCIRDRLCVGDGLSAAAVEANLRQMLPVIKQGVQAAGLTPVSYTHLTLPTSDLV